MTALTPANNNGLLPSGHQPGNILHHNWLPEDRAIQNLHIQIHTASALGVRMKAGLGSRCA